ncbi:hypothetical protein QE374_001280 [Microbacterium sp. SORGH_AS428]|nr:hypothetical protein [Microbacterium sp. SORGH_AS_0428]
MRTQQLRQVRVAAGELRQQLEQLRRPRSAPAEGDGKRHAGETSLTQRLDLGVR